jgi:hypothetical protein
MLFSVLSLLGVDRRLIVAHRGVLSAEASTLRVCRSLCSETDYSTDDGLGHTYYANLCGSAAKQCLPLGWTETYEYGVAVQTWGSVPPCNLSDTSTLSCFDKDGMIPSCCTEDCQILGVGAPHYKLMNPSNAQAGVNATFTGAPPDDDDPFWCPFNPATGSQYSRTVTYMLTCDPTVQGALLLQAVQNSTENCE